jgi:mono/diheme cytochrome c family protein
MELRRPTLLLAVAVVGGVVFAGCGGSDEPSGTVVQPISVGTAEEEFVPSGATGLGEGAEVSEAESAQESEAAPPAESGASSGAESGAESGASSAAAGGQGDAAAGKSVFTGSAGCGSCHTLADAGTSGAVGPNLDDVKPDYDTVVKFVTDGSPPMPAFGGTLSETDIQNVAAYVSSVAGQ